MKLSLKDRLTRYVTNQHGWVAKGDLERLVVEKTEFTADNAGRRLRELAEEGVLETKTIRGHAYYKAKEKMSMEEWWDSLPRYEQTTNQNN